MARPYKQNPNKTSLLLAMLVLAGCIQAPTPSWATPGPSHTIVTDPEYLSKQWEMTIFTLNGALRKNQCVASNGSVMVAGSIGMHDPENLLAFQGSDGTLLWASERTGALAAYDEQVLVGNENTITSLAVSDGSMNWTASLPGARNIVSLMVYEDLLFVSATGSFPFFILGPGDGEIIEKFSTVADFRNRYPAIPFYPDHPFGTVLANGVILQQTGNITYSVHATDIATDEILWQSDSDSISNIALMGNTVFMLTADSTLRLVDLSSGLTIKAFLIQPGIDFNGPDTSVQHAGYYLCADTANQYLYVILGDSRQMLSFRINQSTP